jgi:predicted AlkP superfamily phosphohydrolase/phosphomutase/tetratricopeptide (TPR) repeat protein
MPKRLARKVALIGWDAADWKMIHPLLDRGLMPNLQSIVERGAMGNLATLVPALSPLLWTSIATGHTADRHGIAGFAEPDPILGKLRPVASNSRRTKALWNILTQSGMRSLVVNWFASHLAEPIEGAVVSNIFKTPPATPDAPWPEVGASVHPQTLADALGELRVGPADLTGDDLLPFLPLLDRIDQNTDRRALSLATILSENITVHAAATWLMEHEPWDLLAVYYDTIDHAGHLFMPYHPPRQDHISEEEFRIYSDVMNGVYCFHDLMLGWLMQLAGPETNFLVLSDHGFHSDHRRPTGPVEPQTAMEWHRHHGMLAMCGPGIRHDELVFGAGLLDIAPTVLALLGLPAGEDMRGRILQETFEEPLQIDRVPSWEDVPGECGRRSEEEQDPWDADEVMKQLIALGYIEQRNETAEEAIQRSRQLRDHVLSLVHLSNGQFAEGIALLETLLAEDPTSETYRLYLAQAYFEAGRRSDRRELLDEVPATRMGRTGVSLLRGNLALAEGDAGSALAYLEQAEATGRARAWLAMGRVYIEMRRWDDAERQFRRVLADDPEDPAAHAGLAQALLGQGANQQAAESALDAIGLGFADPRAHYALGAALARLGRKESAVRAFENCLKLQPGFTAARDALAALNA